MRFKEGIARLPVRAAMIQAGRAPWSDSVAIIFFYESEGARSAGRMSAISEETSAHLDRKKHPAGGITDFLQGTREGLATWKIPSAFLPPGRTAKGIYRDR
jgi:hypothetical protein